MKELEKISKISDDKAEIVRQVATSLSFMGSLKLQRGHTCFEINLKTMAIQEAAFESMVLLDKTKIGGVRPTKKIVINKDCYYITALNKKNAAKKFVKIFSI